MLDAGVAREVARGVLPVATYSSMYVTMNARSLMNFLSLRTKREGSHFPSYPQREIEMVAEQMETEWASSCPSRTPPSRPTGGSLPDRSVRLPDLVPGDPPRKCCNNYCPRPIERSPVVIRTPERAAAGPPTS
jgi:hypothetical protein